MSLFFYDWRGLILRDFFCCLSSFCLVVRTKYFVLGLFTVLYSCKTCINVNCLKKCYFHRSKSSTAVERNVETHLLSECIKCLQFTSECEFAHDSCLNCVSASINHSKIVILMCSWYMCCIYSASSVIICIILFMFCFFSYKISLQRKL